MTRVPLWLQRPLLLILGIAAIYAALIPLSPGSGAAHPDVLYCLVIAWVIRRPASAPLWLVLALGLFADLMLSRPLGLGALGLVLAAELARARSGLFQGAPFVLEWLAASLGFAALLAAMELLLRLTFTPAPGVTTLLSCLAATTLAYPLVVAALVWLLGLAAPRGARAPLRPGRLS